MSAATAVGRLTATGILDGVGVTTLDSCRLERFTG
jgi:hypothetical protein